MKREEAILILHDMYNYYNDSDVDGYVGFDKKDNEALELAIKILKQEPRTGHWILDETDNSVICNKCGCLIWANDISDGEAYYCPNCGVKMVDPQESENNKCI